MPSEVRDSGMDDEWTMNEKVLVDDSSLSGMSNINSGNLIGVGVYAEYSQLIGQVTKFNRISEAQILVYFRLNEKGKLNGISRKIKNFVPLNLQIGFP